MLGELRGACFVQHVLARDLAAACNALTHTSCLRFYLDKQRPLSDFNASVFHYEWVDTWIDFYNNEPTAAVAPGDVHLILGGEAAMWAEQVRACACCARGITRVLLQHLPRHCNNCRVTVTIAASL